MSPPTELLTFEDLTEVYRREQRSKAISEVRRDFYPAMRECLEKLKRESEREFSADQFSTKAKLASNQLMKFQEKSAQVFEFRMGKILDMALRAAEGSKIETSRLTVEEQEIYDRVYTLLKERRSVLIESGKPRPADAEEPTMVAARIPDMIVEANREEEVFDAAESSVVASDPMAASMAMTPLKVIAPPMTPTVVRPAAEVVRTPDVPPATVPAPPLQKPAAPALADKAQQAIDFVVLRILEDIPAFAGGDRNYKLKKEDLVSLPPPIAKALIARKKAVGIQFGTERRL
jgi:DNA replication initiation complex subunit (GINS family)